MEQQKRTELNTIGEFGLIDRIKSNSTLRNKGSVHGIGDDAAVIESGGALMVVSTDMLVEGVHFDLSFTPLKHLGFKAVAVNVSDIAAMNAIPTQITVSVAISNRFSLEAIDELYEGIAVACEQYNVDLVGGDTTSSTSGLVISITAIGEVSKKQIAYRHGAEEGDIICVTGDLGAAYLGLQILKREKEVYMSNPEMQPALEGYDYIVGRHLKPAARMDVIYELRDKAISPKAMIDISDGLASELLHISKASGYTLNVHSDKLPIDEITFKTADELSLDPIACAMNGGEDYELLFVIGQDDYEKVKYLQDITLIGYITGKGQGAHLITNTGQAVPIQAQGWKHF